MTLKDKINKISAVGLILSAAVIASGYIFENKEIFGFENAILLYLLLPSAFIWFGTRKNGCGSCNQIPLDSEKKSN
ncbi:hypothetical protein OAK22_04675 [Nitrosopumilus sp.]|nr:hypothetical protein [Nitrosopumilus sp.]